MAMKLFEFLLSIIWRSCESKALFSIDTENLSDGRQTPIAEMAKFDLRADVMRMALLVAIFAVIFWFLTRLLQQWSTRRDGQLNSQSRIKLVEKRVLGPRIALYLFQIPGKQILVAQTPTHLTALAETPCAVNEKEMNFQDFDAPNEQSTMANGNFWSKWSTPKK